MLGRYRLVERIATGGMGEVWRGVDVGWGGIERPVAVKVIAPSFAREPEFVRTFVDEARLSYLLCHSNVVNVRDIGKHESESGDTWFIAMEWIDGGDLGGILKRLRERVGQPMPIRFALLVAVEAARGLDYAHRLRDAAGEPLHVVHRDISPSNLLVSYEGEVKVTDFGIARSRLKTTPSLPGALKGKLGYLSPEQARGESVDPRADLFALGVVLYEMLTGVNPFTHKLTERESLARVQAGAFEPPRRLQPSLPQGLEAIVLGAMAPRLDERYASCGGMREHLEAFARREGYALSAADLGAFVRDLLGTQAIGAQAASEPLRPVSKPREEPGQTIPGKRRELVRTVADEVIAAPAPPVDEAEAIPRTYSRRTLALALGALAAGVGVSVAVTLVPRGRAPEIVPPVVAAPSPVAAVEPTAPPRAGERVTPPAAAHAPRAPRPRSAPERPARLSVDSQVPANIYVDGQFVRVTPIADLELPAGLHTVRAESSQSGLRLIPREETVMLKAGEPRHLNMDLK
jgi:hypothetical protein